ncbi:MAG: superoxide dismutase family protein [Balneolaceae bacterium]|nr:superoxide dismutase family protein [Balneolaceae bacterium]
MIDRATILFFGAFSLLFLAASCTQQPQQNQDQEEPATNYTNAVATIHPTEGNEVSGTVTFTKVEEGVRVQASVEGLEQGRHGFHIHQFGDCSASDGTSAGGHYNPHDQQHGSPTQDARHVGDMGNLVAGSEGTADMDYVDPLIKLNGPNSVIGRGVIVHADEDDFETQPTGAAGARLGCGVIGIDSAEE